MFTVIVPYLPSYFICIVDMSLHYFISHVHILCDVGLLSSSCAYLYSM